MFHHFHSDLHTRRPGSISADDLDRMIKFLRKRFEILSPEEFKSGAIAGRLPASATVLTFDDALQSQLDVALPVLEDNNLLGVFSIYSSVFSERPDPLEVFAAFRADFFSSFDAFWDSFRNEARKREPELEARLGREYPSNYLGSFPFYSEPERRFRFFRDEILGPERYKNLMWGLIESTPRFVLSDIVEALWMKPEGLEKLLSRGHSLGLHSHTHPTRMDLLPENEQRYEYETNRDWIETTLGVLPAFVAHPCGQYSKYTLGVLDELGISVGFRSSLTPGLYHSLLEIPREDHANVMRDMAAS